MIRTVTCLCFAMACGSGLYLYQSKHRVQVLDREIEKTVRGTETLREQTRVLHAEWTLLNDPQRLQALAEQFLDLKTVTPGQFTSLAELDTRLPAVRAPEPPPVEPPPVPVAQAPDVVQPEEPRPASIPAPPPPAKPASVAVAAPPPRPPPEHKPAPPPVVAEAPPVRPVAPRPVAVAEPPRPTPPRMAPVAPVVLPTQAVPLGTGSALGMAHGAAPPPPRPMPVNASQWVTNGGGG